MWDMTHCWRPFPFCLGTRDMTYSQVGHDPVPCGSWTHSYVRHDCSFGIWLIHIWDITHCWRPFPFLYWYAGHSSCTCPPWLIHWRTWLIHMSAMTHSLRNMTHSHVGHGSLLVTSSISVLVPFTEEIRLQIFGSRDLTIVSLSLVSDGDSVYTREKLVRNFGDSRENVFDM